MVVVLEVNVIMPGTSEDQQVGGWNRQARVAGAFGEIYAPGPNGSIDRQARKITLEFAQHFLLLAAAHSIP